MLTFSHLYKHVLGLRKLQFASLLACAGVVESGVVTVWFFFSDNSWDFSVFLLRWYYSCGLMVFKKLCWFPTMYWTHTHTPMLHLAKKWHLSCYKFGSSWVHFQDHLLLLYALFWCFDNFFLFLKKDIKASKNHPVSSYHHLLIRSNPDHLTVSSTIVAPETHLQFERHHPQHYPNHGAILPNLVTKTVSGFMNFVTTVGNTVMVFTPQLGQASRPATGRLNKTYSNLSDQTYSEREFFLPFILIISIWLCSLITAQSTLIVTPTRVVQRFDEPTIGIEGLFQDFQRPAIQPSSVQR